mgnify:CR=1 FL=1
MILVRSTMLFSRLLSKRIFLKLILLMFNRFSFKSPMIIIFGLTSNALSILMLKSSDRDTRAFGGLHIAHNKKHVVLYYISSQIDCTDGNSRSSLRRQNSPLETYTMTPPECAVSLRLYKV